MASERILIEFSADVDGSRDLVAVAGEVAFWFSTSYGDRPAGIGNGAACDWSGHRWYAHWTKARAVSVRCIERVPRV